MSSAFSFQPMGLSQMITVTAAATTFSFSVVQIGGTTLTVGSTAGATYVPGNARIANVGTIPVFISFGPNTVTTGLASGILMLANTVEVFTIRGNRFMATISGGTSTLNLTLGEGV